jgi:hypothetical protein
VIEDFGRVEGDLLVVGEQSYGLAVWPERMTNLRSTTAEMLGEYLAAGALLYGIRPAEITFDGSRSDLLGRWDLLFPDRCNWFPGREALVRAVLERVPPRLKFDDPPGTGLAHMRRVDSDSELFLVVNSSPKRWRAGSR